MFIVPVKGVYAFHLMVLKTGVANNDLYVHIMRDNNSISGAHVTTSLRFGTGSSTALMELYPLNRVYAQCIHGPLHSGTWFGVGTVQFTGYLLYTLA